MISFFHPGTQNLSGRQFVKLFGNFSPLCATAYKPPRCDAHWNQENFVPFKAQRKPHVTLTAFKLNCVPKLQPGLIQFLSMISESDLR